MERRIISLVLDFGLLMTLTSACGPMQADRSSHDEIVGQPGPTIEETLTPKEKETIQDHSPRQPQATGFYSNGRLINATEFPLEGEGFIKVFRPRQRHFGTLDLLEVVGKAAYELKQLFPEGERLQIGDVSDHDGGRLSRHASHQNGLDADLAYFRRNKREMNPELANGFDESFVKKGKVTANFDVDRNWAYFNLLVETGKVSRIFVDAAIKQVYCKKFTETSNATRSNVVEVLRRLRPIANHHDHMHVRLKCPLTSPECRIQQEPPLGSGCPGRGTLIQLASHDENF